MASQAERWIFHHPDDSPMTGLKLVSRMGLVYQVDDLVEGGEIVGEVRGLIRAPLEGLLK